MSYHEFRSQISDNIEHSGLSHSLRVICITSCALNFFGCSAACWSHSVAAAVRAATDLFPAAPRRCFCATGSRVWQWVFQFGTRAFTPSAFGPSAHDLPCSYAQCLCYKTTEKAEVGRVREREKKKKEDQRGERQKKEDQRWSKRYSMV